MAKVVYVLSNYPEVIPLIATLVLFAIIVIRYTYPDEDER